MRFHPLEKLINLHDGYVREFKIDQLQVLLVQKGGDLFLFEAYCPHRAHPLSMGVLDAGVIECALHRYQFSLRDGRVLHTTERPCRDLQVYPVIYEGNEVGMLVEDLH